MSEEWHCTSEGEDPSEARDDYEDDPVLSNQATPSFLGRQRPQERRARERRDHGVHEVGISLGCLLPVQRNDQAQDQQNDTTAGRTTPPQADRTASPTGCPNIGVSLDELAPNTSAGSGGLARCWIVGARSSAWPRAPRQIRMGQARQLAAPEQSAVDMLVRALNAVASVLASCRISRDREHVGRAVPAPVSLTSRTASAAVTRPEALRLRPV